MGGITPRKRFSAMPKRRKPRERYISIEVFARSQHNR
jgi:hypothetical protein